MLSEQEYQETKWQLANFPSEIKGEERNRLRQQLKKKIKEHEHCTTLPPFESMPHIPFFINHTTTDFTLHQLIRAVTTSTEFIIDTESINIYKQKNKPVLIQLQILLPHHLSLVLIAEMHHLPKKQNPQFELIKNLFQIVFSQGKQIYVWGPKDELYPFIIFNLFSREQIDNTNIMNLQLKFKEFWNEKHPRHDTLLEKHPRHDTLLEKHPRHDTLLEKHPRHDTLLEKHPRHDTLLEKHPRHDTLLENTTNNCLCEQCLGKNPSHIWSLQDCIAIVFKEYLSKQLTIQDFHIGLDSNLYPMNPDELHYRQMLIEYAINDCIATQRILIKMKQENFNFETKKKKYFTIDLSELSSVSSDDEKEEFSIDPIEINKSKSKLKNPSSQSRTPSTKEEITSQTNINTESKFINWQSQSSNRNSSSTSTINPATSTHHPSTQLNSDREQLTDEQKKKIHNRSCTVKQRRRYYRNEIIRRGIDDRFTINRIKGILRRLNIPYNVINKSTSKITNKTSLYIGIRDPPQIETYERATRNLFTTQHYNELKHRQQRPDRYQYKHRYEHERKHRYEHERKHRYEHRRTHGH